MDDKPNTLHPNDTRSRKRNHDDPSEEQNIFRERSTSRNQEVASNGKARSKLLEQQEKEKKQLEASKRVWKDIKKRVKPEFCHICQGAQFFNRYICQECEHYQCDLCRMAYKEE